MTTVTLWSLNSPSAVHAVTLICCGALRERPWPGVCDYSARRCAVPQSSYIEDGRTDDSATLVFSQRTFAFSNNIENDADKF